MTTFVRSREPYRYDLDGDGYACAELRRRVRRVLNRLDEIDWTQLTHAYGTAEDIPDLLRALASDDDDEVGEAFDEIIGSIFHQGDVYPATVPAVPFLVELASTAQHRRGWFLATVGMLADPHHAWGEEAEEVCEAVRAQADRFPPLLDDPDPEIRAAAAYTVAQCGDRLPVTLLRDRWATEDDPTVRAALALALGLRDTGGAAGLLAAALHEEEHPVRVAAAVAIKRAGLPWPAGAAEALAAAFDQAVELDYAWQRQGGALDELVSEADERFVRELLGRLLTAAPQACMAAAYAIGDRCRQLRSAPALLLPLLGQALHDPDESVRAEAVRALRTAGPAAAAHADELARVAAGWPAVVEATGFTPQQRAVETLAMLADPRWVDVICAVWAGGHEVRLPVDQPPFDEAVLAAARRHLAGANHPTLVTGLATLLERWGPAASAAVPELVAALPVAPARVAAALAAIGAAPEPAVPELRMAAARGDVRAGVTLWRVTGEVEPVVTAVARQLDAGPNGDDWRLRQAFDAVPALGALLPRLRSYLTGIALETEAERYAQLLAARVVGGLTGDRDAVPPTVQAVLGTGWWAASAAADLVARFPEPQYEPALWKLLGERVGPVAPVRALWRIGVSPDDLAPLLVRLIEEGRTRDVLPLLVEMEARSVLPALRDFAERDARVVTGGVYVDTAWEDERLRRDLRAAVAVLDR
ncbi:HEAT repeat domain-containing protein [Micromonospora soli]|uniref:HEAT repeat domain-containing protein n=1 Tax=Micromonospora sp. NBRC 110009 TaxID=3061627 RepID=UPI0026710E2B|nr:HEAT repeat domain-containing protein [Micromonospora sp. NBRC 110009]WKU00073.1 HEAT repeat domain-containing protein [Micromonospora sp. NBRC 110009]